MIRAFSTLLSKNAPISKSMLAVPQGHRVQYSFGMLMDKLQSNQSKKQQEEMQKQFEYMANKPTFTLMDYRQRILDELQKLRNSIKAKMNKDSQEMEKKLVLEQKVLNAMYEDELNEQRELKAQERRHISAVTQLSYQNVLEVLKKAERYKHMHKILRGLKQAGQPLPKDMSQLQYMYMKSGLQRKGKKEKYAKYKQLSAVKRGRFIKFGQLQ